MSTQPTESTQPTVVQAQFLASPLLLPFLQQGVPEAREARPPFSPVTLAAVERLAALELVPGPQAEAPAQAEPPQPADVQVAFRETQPADLKAILELVGDALPLEVVQELQGAERTLLDWAQSAPWNLSLLVSDPVEALRQCGAGLRPDTLSRLAAYRDDLLRSVSLGDVSRIGRLTAYVQSPGFSGPYQGPSSEKAFPGPEA